MLGKYVLRRVFHKFTDQPIHRQVMEIKPAWLLEGMQCNAHYGMARR